MKYILLLFVLFSCQKEPIFISSEPNGNLVLIENMPQNDSLLKKSIKDFLSKSINKYSLEISHIEFYKHTSETKYFLKKRADPGGFSSEELINYPQYNIAAYIVSNCKSDSLRKEGKFYFYGLEGIEKGKNEQETFLFNCD